MTPLTPRKPIYRSLSDTDAQDMPSFPPKAQAVARPAGVVVALLLVATASCGSSGGGTTPTPPVDNTCVPSGPSFTGFGDLDNKGNGEDLWVRVGAVPATSCGTAYRVFVTRSTQARETAAAAAAVPADRTIQLSPTFSGGDFNFGELGVDADGQAITEGFAYRLHVLALGPDDPVVVLSVNSPTLQNADVVRTLTSNITAGSGGLETDADGNIYTADFGASLSGPPGDKIHRVTPSGEVSIWATGFVGASGNDRAANGDLFQSSITGGTMQRVTPEGSVTTFATGLSGPVGVVALPGDTLIVAGCGDNTIRRIEPDGTVSTMSSSSLLSCPNGIDRGPDGNYYIANFSGGQVLRMTPEGVVSQVVQVPSGNAGHLLWGRGALWVVDRGGHSLYRIDVLGGGSLASVAGAAGQRGRVDGAPAEARLSLPNDIAFSPDSTALYFNDVGRTAGDQGIINPVLVRALIFARPEG